MACTSPPELNDRELLTYVDGEADPRIITHLEQCPHCREKARHLARLQDRLTTRLYRIQCPSPIQLGEYHLGLLPQDQAATVAEHLAGCPHCRREVAQLRDYLGILKTDRDYTALERIKILIAQLVPDLQDITPPARPTPTPTYAGLRGEEQGPRHYQAEDVQVVIGIQEDAEHLGHKVILGLVMGMESSGVKAYLWRAERLVATAEIDELGNFAISDLPPGSYELILRSSEVEIHIQDLEIGASWGSASPG